MSPEEREEMLKMVLEMKQPMDRILKAKKEGSLLKNSLNIMKDSWTL